VEANSTGGQGSRRTVAPNDDDDDDEYTPVSNGLRIIQGAACCCCKRSAFNDTCYEEGSCKLAFHFQKHVQHLNIDTELQLITIKTELILMKGRTDGRTDRRVTILSRSIIHTMSSH
jgi:hypothetical protein